MKITAKTIFQFVIFTAIGTAILLYLWYNMNDAYAEECLQKSIPADECSLTQKLIDDYKGADIGWLIVTCLIFMLSNVLRALQWTQLFTGLGYDTRVSTAFHTTMIGYFANMIPPRIGELLKAGLQSRYENVPYETSLGTLALTRLMDVIFLILILLLGVILFTDDLIDYVIDNSKYTLHDVMLLIGIMLLLAAGGILALRYIYRMEPQRSILIRIKKLVTGFVEGILSLKEVRNKPLFFLYSLGIWGLYVLMHYTCLLSFGPTSHLDFSDSILTFDFGALGMVFPSPGGMGTYHAMIVQALTILDINEFDSMSFAMIAFFTINILCNVAFGILGLILLPLNKVKRS